MKNKNSCLALLCFICIMALPLVSNAFEAVQIGENSSYTIYGWLRNNTGMFMQSQDYAYTGGQLATERTWFRAYGDVKFNNQWRMWVGTQLAFEPFYGSERGNEITMHGGPQIHERSKWKTYSEFDDVNDVLREVYVEWKPNSTTSFKIGRQIAIWGEALTDRVGDVVQPNDGRFAFAFANLEDTRIPQYMVRAIHAFTAINSSLEWIVLAPIVQGQYYVNRNASIAIPSVGENYEQRFAPYGEGRDVAAEGLPHGPLHVIPFGFAVKEVYPDNGAGMRYGFRTATQTAGMQFGVSYFHTHSYDPLTSYGATKGFLPVVPGSFALAEVQMNLVHPYLDIIGLYGNRQTPVGVVRAEMVYSPNKPYNTFDIPAPGAFIPGTGAIPEIPLEDGIVRRDWVKYLVAWDLPGDWFYFPWHNTSPFSVTIEHVGEWIPNARDLQYGAWNTKQPTYHASVGVSIMTDWLYSQLSTALIGAYDTFGDSGLIMPYVTWKPGWWNQRFSAELRYIGIYGNSNYEGLGIFRKKDMLVLTTQLNF